MMRVVSTLMMRMISTLMMGVVSTLMMRVDSSQTRMWAGLGPAHELLVAVV